MSRNLAFKRYYTRKSNAFNFNSLTPEQQKLIKDKAEKLQKEKSEFIPTFVNKFVSLASQQKDKYFKQFVSPFLAQPYLREKYTKAINYLINRLNTHLSELDLQDLHAIFEKFDYEEYEENVHPLTLVKYNTFKHKNPDSDITYEDFCKIIDLTDVGKDFHTTTTDNKNMTQEQSNKTIEPTEAKKRDQEIQDFLDKEVAMGNLSKELKLGK